ncbi:MAG: hypothetical protein GEU75_07165 [Dehalococcoidia bacterium]|nr:hypothetical protein [Dehalococcoidia bacterium]
MTNGDKPEVQGQLEFPAEARSRTLAARVGAFSLHAKYDSRELTVNARRAFARRFEDQVDPERQLPEAERQRRAEAAKRAYMARLALKSAEARRNKKAEASTGRGRGRPPKRRRRSEPSATAE